MPSSAGVLSHGFDFRPSWWQSKVSDEVGAWLDTLPVSEQGRGYHRITRGHLLSDPGDGSALSNCRLLLACYVWGTGTMSRNVGRRARTFRDTPAEVLGRRLCEAREILTREGPRAAYAALDDGGPLRTKHMRASFFTKFLYAADASGHGAPGRALILDQFVAIALNDLHGWQLPERSGWRDGTYQAWLDLAAVEAEKASSREGVPVRVDAVEMAYFQYGRRVAQDRRGGN